VRKSIAFFLVLLSVLAGLAVLRKDRIGALLLDYSPARAGAALDIVVTGTHAALELTAAEKQNIQKALDKHAALVRKATIFLGLDKSRKLATTVQVVFSLEIALRNGACIDLTRRSCDRASLARFLARTTDSALQRYASLHHGQQGASMRLAF